VHFKKDGTPMDLLASSSVIEYGGREAILTINRDITERRRLQQQLIQSEKMAALGQLVSGVAHELNNPLTSVIGYTELLLETASLDATCRERLGIIGREGERARRIINNLLSFARQQKPARTELDLNELLDRILDLRAYEMRVNGITVERRYGSIPSVLGDGHQLQQALMNIIVNAEQAMTSGRKGGGLTVTTESTWVESRHKVAVVIRDEGPGIPEHQLDRVFDPFFTTRPVGMGAGLGLSITYGIVKEHGGAVFARSVPGEGATFVVELPGLSQ
jgi:two-component system NtrC family sensor kinase